VLTARAVRARRAHLFGMIARIMRGWRAGRSCAAIAAGMNMVAMFLFGGEPSEL